ncbi:type II secretion system F family protein [Poriferisphaera sp. WC338]|uniref:type II secretion system F family protein n=1 Tax=Poriferisphaera sp. WC338 TaxID=3425129 RepID=UPI003D819E2B
MPTYRYQMKTSAGETSVGIMTAESALSAAQQLRNQGNIVLQLTPVSNSQTKSLGEKLKALNYQSGPTQRDILNFTTQLAVMIRAGISIRAALEGIADQTENAKFKQILLEIKQDVESGKQFSEALAKHPKLFGPLYINMVRASEMSGSFSQMLERIASYLQQQIETRAMVIGAMIYPAVIGALAIGVTIFLLTFVLPRFAGVFEGKEAAMPWPTVFLMSLSAFMVEWWWAVVIGLLGMVIGFVFFTKTEAGGWWWDGAKLRIPIFSRMFRALYISRSLHTMGELVNAGVPMLDTLAITGEISGNRHFKRLWKSVYTCVKQGKKIANPLQKTKLLPTAVVQMVGAGEESGKLGEVLDEVSSFYARQLREVIKTVTSMIEPIMIIIMGSVVGFIAMAIILPIFKLSTLVK